MNHALFIVVGTAVASVVYAADITLETLQSEFASLAVPLSTATNVPQYQLETQLATFAQQTFGQHPDVLKSEALTRLSRLPSYPLEHLKGYAAKEVYDQFPLPPDGSGWLWLMYGWDPTRVADTALKTMMSRTMAAGSYGRRALLEACVPNKVFRLDEGEGIALVVESLGDLFVVETEFTDYGCLKPKQIKWMTKE